MSPGLTSCAQHTQLVGQDRPSGAAERAVAAAGAAAAALVIFQEETFRVCPNISATHRSSCIPR